MQTAKTLACNKVSAGKITAALVLAGQGKYTDALVLLDLAVKAKVQAIRTAAGLPSITEGDSFPDYKQCLANDVFFSRDFSFVFEHMSALLALSNNMGREVSRREYIQISDDITIFMQNADAFIACHAAGKRTASERSALIGPLMSRADEKLDSATLLYDAQHYDDCFIILLEACTLKIKGIVLATSGDIAGPNPDTLLRDLASAEHHAIATQDDALLFRRMKSIAGLPPLERGIGKESCRALLDGTADFFQRANRFVKKRPPGNKFKILHMVLNDRELCTFCCMGIFIMLVLAAVLLHSNQRSNAGGFTGTYYNGTDLSPRNVVFTRIDPAIDFNWTAQAPSADMPTFFYSVRWSGSFFADAARNYTFSTISDDGVRLWINDMLLIDNWEIRGLKKNTGKIYLSKGLHTIRLEYFQAQGDAIIRLLWDRGLHSRNAVSAR